MAYSTNDPLGILGEKKSNPDPLGILTGEETPKKKVPTEPVSQKPTEKDFGVGSKTTQPTSGLESSQPSETDKVTVGGKEFEVPKTAPITGEEVRRQANLLFKSASPVQVTPKQTPIPYLDPEVKQETYTDPTLANLSKTAVKGNEDVLSAYVRTLPFEEQDRLRKLKFNDEESLEILNQATGRYLQSIQNDINVLKERGVESDLKTMEAQMKEIGSLRSEIEADQKAFQTLQQTFLNQKGYGDLAKQYAEATAQIRKGEKQVQSILQQQKEAEQAINQFSPLIKGDQFTGSPDQYEQYKSAFERYNQLAQSPELQQYNASVEKANAIAGQINKFVTPEYQERSNQLVSKINDATTRYKTAVENFEQFGTPERRDNINQYITLLDDSRKLVTSLEAVKQKMPDVIKKEQDVLIRQLQNQSAVASSRGYDLVARLWNGFSDGVGKMLSAVPTVAGGLSEGYTMSDRVAESISDFFSPKITTAKTEVAGQEVGEVKKFYDPDKNEINWSMLPEEIADQAGAFLLLALTGGAGRTAQVSDAVSIVLPGTLLSYRDALETGKELYGEDKVGATLYASASSLITGITELIMPDRDILTGNLKKEISQKLVSNYLKGGKNFATREAIKTLLTNAGKEVTEELVDRWKDVVLRGAINLTGGDVDLEIPTLQEQLSIVASTAVLTNIAGVGGARAESDNIKKLAVYQAAQNYPETLIQLEALESSGIDVSNVRDEVGKMFFQLKQIPANLSTPKQIAIAEKMNAIDEIENINASGVSKIIQEVNNKKIKEIQGEIETIINDPEFDKAFADQVNSEVEQNQLNITRSAESIEGVDVKFPEPAKPEAVTEGVTEAIQEDAVQIESATEIFEQPEAEGGSQVQQGNTQVSVQETAKTGEEEVAITEPGQPDQVSDQVPTKQVEAQEERVEPIKPKQDETKITEGETGDTKGRTRGQKTKVAGVGRGRVPRSKRKVRNPTLLKAISIEATNPVHQVMQYFIRGGTIGKKALEQIYGGEGREKKVIEEMKSRLSMMQTDGHDVKSLAEAMAEDQFIPGQYDDRDFRDAVEEVINSYTSVGKMATDLIKFYNDQMEEDVRGRMTAEELEAYDEMLMVEDFYDSLTDEQKAAFVANQDDPEFVRQQAEQILQEEKRQKVDDAKDMIVRGLSGLMNKIGGVKNLTEAERTTLIEDLKNLIEGTVKLTGISIQDAVNELMNQLRATRTENITDEDIQIIEDAITPTPERTRKKAFLNRVYKGSTMEELKSKVREYGLDYTIESQKEAKDLAKKFVSEVGYENALAAARQGMLDGAQETFVYAEAIDNLLRQINATNDVDEKFRLIAKKAELMDEIDNRARDNGRKIAALAEVYRSSDFPYEIENLMRQLKIANNGEEVDVETRRRVTLLAAELENVNELLRAHEEKIAELEGKIAFDKIKAEIVEEQLKKAKPSEKAKKLADRVRQGKINKPQMFMAATPASIAWDTAVETAALVIEAGGVVADAVQKAMEAFRASTWYKTATDSEKAQGEQLLTEYLDDYKGEKLDEPQQPYVDENGKIQIPFSLIRQLVTDGVNSIEELTTAIYDMMKDQYDDITERMVRDAITGYGKARYPSRDEILQKISELKRDGQLLSGLEDVLAGSPPKKTGLQRKKPTDTQRELMRKIKDEMKNLPVEAAEAERRWATANDRIKTMLENRIRDLNEQIAKGEREVRNVTPTELTDENKALKAEVERLNKVLDDLVGKKELTHEQRVENALKAIEKAQEELQRQIDESDIAFKEKPRLSDARLDAAREESKRLREIRDKMREESGLAEARRVELYQKRIKKDIADMQRQIAEGRYDKKVRKEKPELDREGRKLMAQKMQLKEKIDEEIEKIRLKNRTAKEKLADVIVDVLNIPKTMVASADLSAPLRQGAILGAKHPIMASRAFLESIKWAFSEKSANDYIFAIKGSPEYVTMMDAGLYLSIPTAKLTAKEEQFMSNLAKRIPLWGKVIAGTERSYTGYLNKLRVDVFMEFYNELVKEGYTGKELRDNLKSFASFINEASGRGKLYSQKLEQATPILGGVFFAPKFVASRLNVLARTASLGYGMPKRARIEMLKTMGVFIGLGGIILAMAAAAGADVDDEPTSSDFGKIVINDVRYDIWGGMQQWVVYLSRLMFGEYTKAKTREKIPLNAGGYNEKTYVSVTGDFLESKASPPLNMALEFGRGQYKYDKKFFGIEIAKRGDKPDVTSTVLGNISPIWQQDIMEISENEGSALAVATGAASFFGIGTQYYEPSVTDRMQVDVYEMIEKEWSKKPGFTLRKSARDKSAEQPLNEYRVKAEAERYINDGDYALDEEYSDSKRSRAINTAITLYNIKNKPEWYRDVFYSGSSDRRLELIFANTKDMTPDQIKKLGKELVDLNVISDEFYAKELIPSLK